MLHGWGLHGGIWQDTVDDLKEKWTVTVVDLPGHGKSDMRHEAYTLQTLAAEVAQVLPQPTMLLGWSLGGMIAMQIAADFPERITRLVLVASTPQFVKSSDWPNAVEPQILEVFATNLQQDFHSTVKHFLALQVLGSSDERNTLGKLQRLTFSRGVPDTRALQTGLGILSQTNLRQQLQKLVCPTLIIYGQHDKLVPQAVGKEMLKLLPEATLRVIDHAGHAPFLSHRQEFLHAITGFLDDNIT